MAELNEQIKQLKESWGRIYETTSSNEALWKPQNPSLELETQNEMVGVVLSLFDRQRAPAGFSPGYHLGKSIVSIHFPDLLKFAALLESGQYNQFKNFSNTLISIINAIQTMVVYSQKDKKEDFVANLSAELSQSLSLLETAQKELSIKLKIINETEKTVEKAENALEKIEDINSDGDILNKRIMTIKEEVETASAEIVGVLNEAKEQKDEITALVVKNIKIQEKVNTILENINEIQKKNIEQEKLIDSLLPKGASAGLASSFSARVEQLENIKWVWMGIFIISLVCLAGFAFYLTTLGKNDDIEFWQRVLTRLPLATPLVWLGWFSAVQYGNTIRIQEDYAFKEATSKAFQGYRDHMQNMSEISTDEAQSALSLLSIKTIDILSHEPIRLFGKTEHDASPTHSLIGTNIRGTKIKKTKPVSNDET